MIVYQEQVMQLAQEFSGFTLGEADILRRAMGKKIASEMEEQKEPFITGAIEKGKNKRFAEGLFDQIEKFDGTKKYFLDENGENFSSGELVVQSDLSKTLKTISKNGKSGFYDGEIAKNIVDDVQQNGGILTLDDLKNYEAKDS